jgi:hypothetical protein
MHGPRQCQPAEGRPSPCRVDAARGVRDLRVPHRLGHGGDPLGRSADPAELAAIHRIAGGCDNPLITVARGPLTQRRH